MSAAHDPNVATAFFSNGVLAWGLAACGTAQLSKLVIELVVHRRWRPAVLVETGGMPSSHSALMTGTTAAIGWQLGFADPLFALASALCFVVLYDASGVRRAAGQIASRVNGLPDRLWLERDGGGDEVSAASSRSRKTSAIPGSRCWPAASWVRPWPCPASAWWALRSILRRGSLMP